ncbi:unnamed protein product, partial [Nesidiocoris tenuis]
MDWSQPVKPAEDKLELDWGDDEPDEDDDSGGLEFKPTPSATEALEPNPDAANRVTNLRALLVREKDDDTPRLNVLLCEAFVATYMALAVYALATCDCYILYRLAGQNFQESTWAVLFGEHPPDRKGNPRTDAERSGEYVGRCGEFHYKTAHAPQHEAPGPIRRPDGHHAHERRQAHVPRTVRLPGNVDDILLLEQELPVCSPLIHGVMRTVQHWQDMVKEDLESRGPPPPRYIPGCYVEPTPLGQLPGPAIHKYRTILERGNTPF